MPESLSSAFKVSDETIKRTEKCKLNQQCLLAGKCGKNGICSVELFIKDDLLFVEKGDDFNCPYAMQYGYSHVCQCPTRCEIYKRYGK